MPGQEKTKTILRLPAPCKQPEEAARNLLVSYMAGSLTPAGKRDFEIHCLLCDECRYTLEIIQHLMRSPIGEEEKTSAPLGKEAARIARWDCKGKSSSNRVTSQHAAAR
jgi:predicted nucleic acid-binding Zn ribbon protein